MKKILSQFLTVTTFIVVGTLISSCTAAKKDIVGVASENAKTLAVAVTAAGLVETLQGKGPFTVFAPTDAAFVAIQNDVDNLLKPENKQQLVKLLSGHVVNGNTMASDLKDGQELTTIDGGKLKVVVMSDGKIMVGDSYITVPDVIASNGVVHLIDKVILTPNPPVQVPVKDIVDIASESAKTLAAAITAAGLVETLKGAGPFTVFAPTDAAFVAIQSDVDVLLKPESKNQLTKILTYHVVSGKSMAADLKDGQMITTVEGSKLKVTIENGNVMIDGAKIITADIPASNGVIHLIDKVVMPKM